MIKLTSIALLSSLLVTPAFAAEPSTSKLQEIARTKTILMGHLSEAVPFSFTDTDGQAKGYSVDLCSRVAAGLQRQLGLDKLDIKWVPVTQENRFEMVAEGKIDLECGTSTNTISRQKIVDFSLMTWVDGGNFLTKGEQPVKSLVEMNGKKIAVIADTTIEKALKAAMNKQQITIELVPVENHMDGMILLDQQKVDGYASDQTVLIGLAATVSKKMKVSMAEQNYSYEPYALTLRRNDADLKQAVNAALAQLYRSGESFRVYNTWFSKFGKPPQALILMYGMNALPE